MAARLTTLLASLAFLALLGPASSASTAAGKPATRYYLALGDSLAQGMQPDTAGLIVNTNQGYADQLYALEKRRIPNLKLVKLGCGGETTTSMLTGRGNPDAILLGCTRAGGSQLAAAQRFLHRHRHRGEVALLTLDIGANDVVGCASGASFSVSCVTRGVERIHTNLPVIMRRLRRAAAPGVPMASMTLYDPFLQLYLTPATRTEALDINFYARNLNKALEKLYRGARFRIAHVDTAFKTYETSATTPLAGQPQPVPVAVAEICRLTWMCAPAPVGPDIHANQTGYGVIARAFAAAFGRPEPAIPPKGGR
jgi:lysophospholipase L1-like esterase